MSIRWKAGPALVVILMACDPGREPADPTGLGLTLLETAVRCVERTPTFGTERYVREPGPPQRVLRRFCVGEGTRRFILTVENGRGGGRGENVTSAVVELNGVRVVGPEELGKQVDRIRKRVDLEDQNEIVVEVRGQPGTSVDVTVGREEVSETIAPSGGSVTLADVGQVSFPVGAFETPQSVTLYTTTEPETDVGRVRWDVSVGSPAEPATFDVRIASGALPPAADLDVALLVPDEFSRGLPPGHEPRLFVQVVQGGSREDLDLYEPLASDFDPGSSVVTATVPAAAVRPPEPDGDFEIVVILGSMPSAAASASISGTAGILQQACPLSRISPPLQGALEATDPFDPGHNGVDYRGDDVPVIFAGERGTIRSVGFQATDPSPRGVQLGLSQGGAGEYITVRHDDGSVTKYFHLVRGSTDGFEVGDVVTRGQRLGIANSTPAGGVTGPHLHFEYRDRSQRPVDPDACIVRVASVQVIPADVSIEEGAAIQLRAELRNDADSILDGRLVVWSSTDESVAVVDQVGLVDGVGAGTVTVIARSEGVEGTAVVTVEPEDVPDFSGEWEGDVSGDDVGGSWTWSLEQSGTSVTGVVFAPGQGDFSGEVESGVLSATIFYPSTGARNVGTVRKVDGNTLSGDFVLILENGREFPFSSTLTRAGSSTANAGSIEVGDPGALNPDGSGVTDDGT